MALKNATRSATLALLLSAALPAAAQEPAITMTCGGIGLEESLPMRQAQQGHALTVLFATESGGYVADVRTRIDSPMSGAVAEHERCGPVAQVDVTRAGHYRLRAELDGVVREEVLELSPQGGHRIVLRWPE